MLKGTTATSTDTSMDTNDNERTNSATSADMTAMNKSVTFMFMRTINTLINKDRPLTIYEKKMIPNEPTNG